MRSFLGIALVAAVSLVAGCDGEEKERGTLERPGRAATPPPGWRTVSNRGARFTIAVPRRWSARPRRNSTLIRSDDRLVVVTVAADRGQEGRDMPPARYARLTLQNLPAFEGRVSPSTRRVRGSPYRSALVHAIGTVHASKRPQRITVAAYRRPGRVTYAAVVFRNLRLTPAYDEAIVDRMLASLRG